jgi:ergothioneine biosynthesis protein EgtB
MSQRMKSPQPPFSQRGSADLVARYRAVRSATEALCAPLSPEDCQAQSMDDASPAKWHLAHTSWFFETFVLERGRAGYRPFRPEFRTIFNSYYQSVGPQHPRPQRGLLTRPTLAEVRAYRAHVDGNLLEWLSAATDPMLVDIVELGLQHEQQHQELILTDVKHLLAQNPVRPAYVEANGQERSAAVAKLGWHAYPGAIESIGHDGDGFSFDNETPQHRVVIQPFQLASRLVTDGEVLDFIADGGYRRPELWLSDAWAMLGNQEWRAPLYWEERDGAWATFTLTGIRAIERTDPACHLSFYEADAVARWAGARLPTEAEWEIAALHAPIEGNFVEERHWHPRPAARGTDAVPAQLFGDVWEWTQSPYQPYPGYRVPAGALGEYNGKFMCNQFVLRGGSCATPRSHIRATYRNFFPPHARWQFSGLRLARDA